MPGPALALAGGSLVSGIAGASAAKKAAKAQQAAADNATALQRDQFNQTTQNYKPYLDAGNNGLAAYLYEMGLGPKPTFGGTAPTIETIAGQPARAGGGARGYMGGGGYPSSNYRPAGGGGGTPTTYRVGEQTFSTLGEAEAYANANKTGGQEYGGYTQSPMAKYLMEEGVDSIQGSAAASGGLFSGASMEALENSRRTVIGADTSDYFSKLFGLTGMGMSAAGNQAAAGGAYANNVGSLQMQAAQAKGQGYMGVANAIGSTVGDMAGIYGYFGGQNNPMAAYASPTMTRPQPNPYY